MSEIVFVLNKLILCNTICFINIGGIVNVSLDKILIEIDKGLDFVPFVSSVSNLVDYVAQKILNQKEIRADSKIKYYYEHIKNKDINIFLFIPFVNTIFALFFSRRKDSEIFTKKYDAFQCKSAVIKDEKFLDLFLFYNEKIAKAYQVKEKREYKFNLNNFLEKVYKKEEYSLGLAKDDFARDVNRGGVGECVLNGQQILVKNKNEAMQKKIEEIVELLDKVDFSNLENKGFSKDYIKAVFLECFTPSIVASFSCKFLNCNLKPQIKSNMNKNNEQAHYEITLTESEALIKVESEFSLYNAISEKKIEDRKCSMEIDFIKNEISFVC